MDESGPEGTKWGEMRRKGASDSNEVVDVNVEETYESFARTKKKKKKKKESSLSGNEIMAVGWSPDGRGILENTPPEISLRKPKKKMTTSYSVKELNVSVEEISDLSRKKKKQKRKNVMSPFPVSGVDCSPSNICEKIYQGTSPIKPKKKTIMTASSSGAELNETADGISSFSKKKKKRKEKNKSLLAEKGIDCSLSDNYEIAQAIPGIILDEEERKEKKKNRKKSSSSFEEVDAVEEISKISTKRLEEKNSSSLKNKYDGEYFINGHINKESREGMLRRKEKRKKTSDEIEEVEPVCDTSHMKKKRKKKSASESNVDYINLSDESFVNFNQIGDNTLEETPFKKPKKKKAFQDCDSSHIEKKRKNKSAPKDVECINLSEESFVNFNKSCDNTVEGTPLKKQKNRNAFEGASGGLSDASCMNVSETPETMVEGTPLKKRKKRKACGHQGVSDVSFATVDETVENASEGAISKKKKKKKTSQGDDRGLSLSYLANLDGTNVELQKYSKKNTWSEDFNGNKTGAGESHASVDYCEIPSMANMMGGKDIANGKDEMECVGTVSLSTAECSTCPDPESVFGGGACPERKKKEKKKKKCVSDNSLSVDSGHQSDSFFSVHTAGKINGVKSSSQGKEMSDRTEIQPEYIVIHSDADDNSEVRKGSESGRRTLNETSDDMTLIGEREPLVDVTCDPLNLNDRDTPNSNLNTRVSVWNSSVPSGMSPEVVLETYDESSLKVNDLSSMNGNYSGDFFDPFSNVLPGSYDWDSLENEILDSCAVPEEDKEKMKNLQVMCLHTVHPSHTIERAVSRVPTPAEKEALAHFNIRTSNFTKEENRILCENIKKFLKDHGFKDASPFVTAGAHLRAGARREVMQYLGQGLPHRSLHQINQRFMAIIRNENKKPFTSKEDETIKTVLKARYQNPFSVLSKVLNRSRLSVYKRAKYLLENVQGLGGSKIREFSAHDLAEKILQMLTAEKKCRPEALKNRRIKMKVWRKVAEKLDMRPRQLYDYWKHQLHCSLFAEGPVSKGETLMKIVEWLHDIQPKNGDEIPWVNSTHLVPGATSWFMFATFRDLRGAFKADSFKSFPAFLDALYRWRREALEPYNGVYLRRYRINPDKTLTVIREEKSTTLNQKVLRKQLGLFFKKAKDLDVLKLD